MPEQVTNDSANRSNQYSDRAAAESAIASQDAGASGSRADTYASQVGSAGGADQSSVDRNVTFRPESEAGPGSGVADSSAGSSGLSAGSAGASGVSSAQSQQAADWESLTDAARGLGYQGDLSQFGDDRQFLLHLLNNSQAKQQEDYYAQLGRQLAPHYQGIQDYLGTRQQAQGQGGQPPTAQEWEPPEFSEDWLQLVQRDPQSGVFLARQGVNPAIADKVNAYDRWHRKYGSNPVAAVRPMLQAELPKMLGDMIRTELGNFRREQTVNSIVARNSEWMYQQNNGRPVIGVGGQMVPTPQGMRYGQLVQQLERGGMSDPSSIDTLARQVLMGELAMGQLQQANGQAPAQQQQNALASGRSQSNVLQSLGQAAVAAGVPGATQQDTSGMSLHEMLTKALEGYSDAELADPMSLMR